jgi:hypothetical protein
MSRYAMLDPTLTSSASDKKESSISDCSFNYKEEKNKQ